MIINEVPPAPSKIQRAGAFLTAAAGILESDALVDRRSALLAPLATVFSAKREKQAQIIPVEYEPSRGQESFYWLPQDRVVAGDEATGLYKGGPWDKYDALDRFINGYMARSAYWRPTRDWLIDAAISAFLRDEAKGIDTNATGYCMDGAAASFFAPKISGSVEYEGINFTEEDRRVIATLRYGGLKREQVNFKDLDELEARIENGEAVVVNYSPYENQDWWGLATKVDRNGIVTIARTLNWGETGLKIIYRDHTSLLGSYSLNEDRAEPGFEGNFVVVDRRVGGLIVGTHQFIG